MESTFLWKQLLLPAQQGRKQFAPWGWGAVNQYSVVTFSSDLPPVSYINLVPYENYDTFVVHVRMRRKGSTWPLIYFKHTEVMCMVTYKFDLRKFNNMSGLDGMVYIVTYPGNAMSN
jgi:hypothetical protein